MADLRKHVKRAAEQVERLPRHMGGRAVAEGRTDPQPLVKTWWRPGVPRTDPQRSRQTPMWAMLRAGSRVRGGFHEWLRGAPTHVLAELLTELREDGFEVVPVDGRLTVEEARAAVDFIYERETQGDFDRWHTSAKQPLLAAADKLRRIAGREDS